MLALNILKYIGHAQRGDQTIEENHILHTSPLVTMMNIHVDGGDGVDADEHSIGKC